MKTNSLMPDSASRDIWSVVVVYEDLATRERAMAACDQLINQFWPEIEFKFLWWRTDFLEDANMAMTAAENASESDFVVFCGGPDQPLSLRVRQWFKSWTQYQNGRDMALLDLTDAGAGGSSVEKKNYLKELAERARVEYLTNTPTSEKRVIRVPIGNIESDVRVPSVIDRILNQQPGGIGALPSLG